MSAVTCISHSWHSVLLDLLSESNTLDFVSPFITVPAVRPIVEGNLDVRGITVLTPPRFLRGASDIKALELLVDRGARLRSLASLHAKLFIFDDKAVVTSANLTEGGLRRNIEYGVLIHEGEAFQKVKSDFERLFKKAHEIKPESLLVIKRIIENTPAEMKDLITKVTEEILPDKQAVIQSLAGWTRHVYEVVLKLSKEEFELQDLYRYRNHFSKLYPDNKHIEDKIRQTLQFLRDDGLVVFLEPGRYRRITG